MGPAERWNRRVLVIIVVVTGWVIFAPIGYLFLYFSGLLPSFDPKVVSYGFDTPPAPLDRAKWDAGAARDRIGMAKALVRDKTLIGRTRTEVIELIGPPDTGDWWMLATRGTGVLPNTDWLSVDFGRDGRVTEARIFTGD